MELAEFNALDSADAADVVRVWAAIPAWVDAVVAARPYASVAALRAYGADLAGVWSRADLDAALAHHPRIGERPVGSGAGAAASRSEQAAVSIAGDDVIARIAAGNAAYEQRFGRVFLIRAAGRAPDEIAAELERRLTTDDDTEAREAIRQLGQIALLRLEATVAEPDADEREADE
ncbi:MAG: 2-oxo-4-hydroxy-4-carboxy-5-ureidoimidazoline decarboxylase [Actinobacteria bacterium]|nr:2-oxo-4-hydroxy-4-carboxy-5-ureidoimidazoline decarboxylase [Actinomycetota bacterium]